MNSGQVTICSAHDGGSSEVSQSVSAHGRLQEMRVIPSPARPVHRNISSDPVACQGFCSGRYAVGSWGADSIRSPSGFVAQNPRHQRDRCSTRTYPWLKSRRARANNSVAG